MQQISKSYWELLALFEDYLETGYHRHRTPPQLRAIAAAGSSGSAKTIGSLKQKIAVCTLCGLSAERSNTVPGEGVLKPLVFVIGEAPGADEDRTGRPFVGKAGQYLDKWLNAIGLDRKENCFIGNIVKCRPPGNRDPLQEESLACLPYLEEQIKMLNPKVILSLGRIASQILTGSSSGITALRGKIYEYRGIPLIPTFHPSGVLRNPEYRKPVWDDLRTLKNFLSDSF